MNFRIKHKVKAGEIIFGTMELLLNELLELRVANNEESLLCDLMLVNSYTLYVKTGQAQYQKMKTICNL